MSLTKYAPVERWPTEKSEYYTDSLEDEPGLSTPVNPYVSRPAWTYLQYLVPLFAVFVFPFTLAVYVDIKGPVPAPQRLASFAKSSPKATAQIVAILATSLTATTRWALGGAAALLARKRFLRPRPIYELDMFFSLRNISVIWDWKHRKRMMLLTWFLVAVCGLLTSGFFTLLNPLAMEVQIQHPSIQEINVLSDSDSWAAWYRNQTSVGIWMGSVGTLSRISSMSDIPSLLRTMSRKFLASRDQETTYPTGSFVTSFSEFSFVSFIGSTAGTLVFGATRISGAGGVLPLGRPEHPSYTLNLQGTWIDVSCSMGGVPSLNLTFDPSLSAIDLDDEISYNFTCPGSSTTRVVKNIRVEVDMVLAFNCPMENGTSVIFFKQVNDPPYFAVDRVSCNVSPQVGDVEVTLNPDVEAFNVTKRSSPTLSLTPFARTFTDTILGMVINLFEAIPVMTHTWEVMATYGNSEDSYYKELMEMVLITLFEFEATNARASLALRMLRFPEPEQPPGCMRDVTVMLNERTVGWEVKWPTWLGLAPVAIVCAVAFTVIAMALLADGGLTLFDPMSPVSLLAATSVGRVAFPNQVLGKVIGDPLDEDVLVTKVSYTNSGQTWGMWSSNNGSGQSV